MISLNDVLLAASNIPVGDPLAEMWGAMLCGGYTPIIIEYTGALPITISANGDALLDYRIYGASGGVGEGVDITGLSEPLCGIGTHTDSLDLSTGILTRRIKKLVLTGEESWRIYNNTYYIIVNDYYRMYDIGSHLSVCSHYPNEQKYSLSEMHYGLGGLIDETSQTQWNGNIVFNPSPMISSLSDWTSWLSTQYAAGTPITLWYVLAEPDVSTIPVPSGLTGTIEGYLIQDGTPTPETPIYPTANGVKQADGTYSIEYGYKLPMVTSDGTTETTTPVYIGDTPLGEDEYVDYGEQKVYKRKTLKDIGDTVSVNGDLWDIVNYNNDFTRATLLRHETMPEMVYSARQAIFAFPSGLAAGDYHFTIAQHSWVLTDIGKTLTFTLTQAIPEGGQLVLNAAYNVTMVGTTISSYASPTTTTAIETVTMTEGDSGTDLGSLTNAGTPASSINSLQKALLGSNEWKTSALRQYLNSDKAAGSVWIPQTIYDRPPTWATNTAGFMVGLDEDFLSCVGNTTYVTVRNTVSDGGGTDTLTDKFYLPSRTEIFGDNEIENTPEGTLYQYYVNATKADRIKYRANTARSWRLRTPYAPDASYVHSVYHTGAFYDHLATYALGFAPACQIDLTKLNNSWILANFYKPTLTPTDPPVPLPALPTIDGTTVIDCELADKPSQMYIKYKGKG